MDAAFLEIYKKTKGTTAALKHVNDFGGEHRNRQLDVVLEARGCNKKKKQQPVLQVRGLGVADCLGKVER